MKISPTEEEGFYPTTLDLSKHRVTLLWGSNSNITSFLMVWISNQLSEDSISTVWVQSSDLWRDTKESCWAGLIPEHHVGSKPTQALSHLATWDALARGFKFSKNNLWADKCPEVVFATYPEIYSHPYVVSKLFYRLVTPGSWPPPEDVKATNESDGVNFIVSTFDTLAVSAAGYEATLVMIPDSNGLIRIKRLSEHPEAEKYSKTIHAGEFLFMVGDEWVLE